MRPYSGFQKDQLIIFSRYPVPGQTKTRLIPSLGPVRAADLQRRLTEKTLDTARRFISARDIGLQVSFEGGSNKRMQRWLGSGLMFSKQASGDLGERMHSALLCAFNGGCRRVVLIGTDIPDLEPDHLEQAFEELDKNDLVLGPSTDGGYWLIGLKQPVDIFREIRWGTETVFDHTVAQAKREGMEVKTLDPLSDIDTIDDLMSRRPEETHPSPYVSVIIPALNEEAKITSAIRSARDDEAEVIVVDGGSSDQTVKRASEAGVVVVESKKGRAVQQNCGASIANGRNLLFLHADTVLPDDYIQHIFDVFLDNEVIAGAFRFKTDLDRPMTRLIEIVANIRSIFLRMPYGDQAIFIRRGVFDSLGGFPEVPIAEDLFLMRSFARHGRIEISPAYAITSGRRWAALGMFRTTLINYIIAIACHIGIPLQRLAPLYRTRYK